MFRTAGRASGVAAAAWMVATALAAQGPPTQQARQQAQMQQQIAQQMGEMVQQMERLRERIHVVDRNLQQQMERTQDRDRIRQHEMLREMCRDMDDVTGEMLRNAERIREMAQERVFMQDPELEREMLRLRENWDEMGERLRESVEALERMQKRLGEPPTVS